MKTLLIILVLTLLFVSCSAPVTRPETHSRVAVDSVKVDTTVQKSSGGLSNENALGSLVVLALLYVILWPKN
jgi:hypothetical protein